MKKLTIFFPEEGDIIIEYNEITFGDIAYAACKLTVIAADEPSTKPVYQKS